MSPRAWVLFLVGCFGILCLEGPDTLRWIGGQLTPVVEASSGARPWRIAVRVPSATAREMATPWSPELAGFRPDSLAGRAPEPPRARPAVLPAIVCAAPAAPRAAAFPLPAESSVPTRSARAPERPGQLGSLSGSSRFLRTGGCLPIPKERGTVTLP